MNKQEFKKTILRGGRIRWSKDNVTIEKRGERKFWVRVQISEICDSRQATFETWTECEVFANKRLYKKERNGLNSLPANGIRDFHEAGRAVQYLKLEEVEAFIRCAEKLDPELVVFLVLMLFVGIRPNVVQRMGPVLPELIDLEYKVINVSAFMKKGLTVNETGTYVIECNNPGDIWVWLSAYWDGGPLKVHYFQERCLEIAKAAGVVLSPGVFRRTFATFDFAYSREMGKVAAHLGHSVMSMTDHYVNFTAKRRDARAFFALRPLPGAKPVKKRLRKILDKSVKE